MNVAEALNIPALAGCGIIAGIDGKENEILHVNMMDAPDISNYLKPNELLVTTAYHVKDDPQLLLDLIVAMDEKGCAALGIKTQRFLMEVPKEVKALADKLKFPVIELPIETSLGDIVNQTLSSILDKRTDELRFALDTHKQFSDHIMSGKGIQKLLLHLTELIRYPVVLVDPYGKAIASSEKSDAISEVINNFYSNSLSAYFPKTSFFTFSTIVARQTYTVSSVYTYEKIAGYLIIFGHVRPDYHAEMLTLEQAANVISFELMKENALKQYERRIRNEFFFHFTEDRFSSDQEALNRAKEFALPSDSYYLCAIGKVDKLGSTKSFTSNQRKMDTIYEFMEEELDSSSLSTHLFTRGDLVVLLFEADSVNIEMNTVSTEALAILQTKISDRFDHLLSFGISNLARGFIQVKASVTEAQDALKAGQLAGKKGFMQYYQTKDVLELLRMLPKNDLKDFYHHTLKDLAKPTQHDRQTLLQTLFVYLESHCQISETAKQLYVHRNTVVYRLEKCEEIIGHPLTDPDFSLRVRLALRMQTILEL
ncbi:PucR family transcriptional regulator [Paraliobacillus sediminis]|uniref:PucR family transcriptional regulator n=1 Tax=Paraliobacillus sediminis TaxID=1885916 RepID=UPI000E3DE3C9|nr:PucR family transcriptional regulator [Paraliobacillus sediminis]